MRRTFASDERRPIWVAVWAERSVHTELGIRQVGCIEHYVMLAVQRHAGQSKAAPALAFTTVPVIIRARSEAISTAAFAVSLTVAGVFRKLEVATCPMACSLLMFILPATNSMVS